MKGDIIPYQIGEGRSLHHVFNPISLSATISRPLKTTDQNYPLGHGNGSLSINKPDYFDDWIIDITFQVKDVCKKHKDTHEMMNNCTDDIYQILHSYPCAIIPIFLMKKNCDGITWLVNYFKPTGAGIPDSTYQTDAARDCREMSIQGKLIKPYFTEASGDDFKAVDPTKTYKYKVDECLPIDECLPTPYTAGLPMSGEDYDYTKFCDCKSCGPSLMWWDRWFTRELPGIDKSECFEEFELTEPRLTNEYFDVEKIIDSNGYNYLYQLELPPLEQGQNIVIRGFSGSSISVTWTSLTPYPNPMVYNSATGLLYDSLTGDTVPVGSYTIDSAPGDREILYFGNGQSNSIVGCESEQLCFSKNFDDPYTIGLKLYPTHI